MQRTYNRQNFVDPAHAEEYRSILRRYRFYPWKVAQSYTVWYALSLVSGLVAVAILLWGANAQIPVNKDTFGVVALLVGSIIFAVIFYFIGGNVGGYWESKRIEKATAHIPQVKDYLSHLQNNYVVPQNLTDDQVWDICNLQAKVYRNSDTVSYYTLRSENLSADQKRKLSDAQRVVSDTKAEIIDKLSQDSQDVPV